MVVWRNNKEYSLHIYTNGYDKGTLTINRVKGTNHEKIGEINIFETLSEKINELIDQKNFKKEFDKDGSGMK